MTQKETRKLTRAIYNLMNETEIELPESTIDEKITWIKTLSSAIETSNEHAEEYGFVPLFMGPFNVDDNLTSHQDLGKEIDRFKNFFIETIQKINKIQDQLDRENDKYQNLTIHDFSEDPETKNITVLELREKMKKKNHRSKMRRIHWNGHLELIFDMMEEAFDDIKEIDVVIKTNQ